VSVVDIPRKGVHGALDVRSLAFIEKHCERPYFVRKINRYVRCGSGDPSVCRKCASIRSLDKKRIIGSGCNASELDGITWETLQAYRFFFVTFTAPSFGKIRDGVPVDAKRYEYRRQVAWNQRSRDLFHATTDALARRLPDAEWVFVREWQKRGAIHFHGIVRVPQWVSSSDAWGELKALRAVQSQGIAWGRQMNIQSVGGDDRGSVVRYMSKVVAYTAKHQSGDRGALTDQVAAFYERLDKHAQNLVCNRKGCAGKRVCDGRMHRTHGYAGQMLTKSKGWSFAALTFGELRAQRSRFAGTGSSTLQQAELEEAARLARIGYEAAFEGMEASAVVAGADRLRRTLARVLARQTAETTDDTSDG